jgi:hypothetical protein
MAKTKRLHRVGNMKTNKSDLSLKSLDLPIEPVTMEPRQSTPSFSIDVETAKNMVSGTCVLPSDSREFVICKEEEKIKIFQIVREKDAEESILIVKSAEGKVYEIPARIFPLH